MRTTLSDFSTADDLSIVEATGHVIMSHALNQKSDGHFSPIRSRRKRIRWCEIEKGKGFHPNPPIETFEERSSTRYAGRIGSEERAVLVKKDKMSI